MLSLQFDPKSSLIIATVRLTGEITGFGRFILDTGASYMMISNELVNVLGLKINPSHTVKAATASQVETFPIVTIPEVMLLDKTAYKVKAMVKDLPPESHVDGLLGLSFLRHFQMTIDFPNGKLSLK